MKTIKYILTIALLMLPFMVASANDGDSKATTKRQFASFVKEFRHEEDFNAINLGSLGSSVIKGIIGAAADKDKDMKEFIKAISGVKSFTLVDYEDCSPTVKSKVQSRLDAILGSSELLLEARDEDDVVRIFGSISKDGSKASDIIIYTSDCAVIYMGGTIDVAKLTASAR